MKIKKLLVFVVIVTTGILHAQKDFKPGYIITNTGDTVHGEIDYRGDYLMNQKCTFRHNVSNTESVYYPGDILGYRFPGSKYYITKEINNAPVFLEYLVNGQVSIYCYRTDGEDRYYLDKEGIPIVEIPYKEEIIYDEKGMPHVHEPTKHIGVLGYYMQDAPGIKQKIEYIKKPDHKSLIKLAGTYHNMVCDDRSCIIYEKKLPAIKVNFGVVAGISNFPQSKLKDHTEFVGGILAYVWLPRSNERIYFKTGFLFLKFEYWAVRDISYWEVEKKLEEIYKIPLQLEYIYPNSIIKPKLAIGKNIYLQYFERVTALTGGVNIALHEKIFVNIDVDIDFYPKPGILKFPDKVLSKSISTGIQFRF